MHTITAPVEMPVIDSPLDPEVAEALGDNILLSSVASTKVAKVGRTGQSRPTVEVRGWTMGGRVD